MEHYQSQQRQGVERGLDKNTEWVDSDLAVKADVPLIDSGTGKKVIIRMFDFNWDKKAKPEDIESIKNDKQGFFNSHAKYIKDFLWKDGLSILENQDPKLEFKKNGYRIAVACEARFGVSIFEKPAMLQDLMKIHNKKMVKK